MVDYFAVFKGRHVWPRAKTPIHTACVIETSGAIGRALPKPMLTSHNQDGFLQQTCPLRHPLHTGENTGLGAAFQVLIPPPLRAARRGIGYVRRTMMQRSMPARSFRKPSTIRPDFSMIWKISGPWPSPNSSTARPSSPSREGRHSAMLR